MGYISTLFPDRANHITARDFLSTQVYPILDRAMNDLLIKIEQNGEFERYVDMLQERQVNAQKELKKREVERRKLEMGDDYESNDEDRLIENGNQ